MNFLQLANRLKLECGVSGNDMTTVISQPAEFNRLVTWINAAWLDIQSMREDWQWMRASATFNTVTGKSTYSIADTGVSNFGSWYRDTFRNYVTATGLSSEMTMDYVDYEYWRDTYLFGANRNTTSQPNVITITPDKSIGLGPVPIIGYTVTGDYFKVATSLALDTDTPLLPAQFHMAIVYRAMMSYGAYEAASEVYQRGESEFSKQMRRAMYNQLPGFGAVGALA